MANLSSFVGALKDGGTRANQFEVSITGGPVTLPQDFSFLCRTTAVPTMTIGEIPVPYRGRQIFVSGDRTYEPWSITVLSDRTQQMRAYFETWQNHLGDIGNRTDRSEIGTQPSKYYANAQVQQRDRNDSVLRTYHLYDVWPTTVEGYELNYETNDALLEFAVTLRFNYMTVAGAGSSTASASVSVALTLSGPQ